MAIFHLRATVLSRSANAKNGGRSVVAAVAYRAGCKLVDEARTGLTFDYRKKRDVIYTRVLAPKSAPAWVKDIPAMANALEACGKRKDSQLAREIEIALPVELDHHAQISLVERYVYSQFVKRGMVAHVSLHDAKKGNPHAHILLSLNEITADGFGKKCRDWNENSLVNEYRYQWSSYCNRSLANRGIEARVSHLSLDAQGITDREPKKRQSRLDYAEAKRAAANNNNNKENTMKLKQQDVIPPFEQSNKLRMNNLHVTMTTSKPLEGIPNRNAEMPYRYWLADLFGVQIEDVVYTCLDWSEGYRVKLPTGSVMDYGDKLRCETSSAEEVSAVIRLAQAKGWTSIQLAGNESFKQQAFVFAVAQGFKPADVSGYNYTQTDIAMAEQMKAAMQQATQAAQSNAVTQGTTTQGAAKLQLNPPGGMKP